MAQNEHDQRYWLIELLAYWEGRVNVSYLEREFHLSRQQASKVLGSYRQQMPDNLDYSYTQKAYLPSAGFASRFISGEADEYLQWLQGIPRHHLQVARLSSPQRQILPHILRPIIHALTFGYAVDINYASVTNTTEERIIAPHSLVLAAGRWHVRAWCLARQEYRDFVLARTRTASVDETRDIPSPQEDHAWHTWVELVFAPDNRLAAERQQALVQEYGMTDGRLIIRERAALANYLIKQMGVNIKFLDALPEAQQLVLVNKRDIEQWLY
ncbi:WYL domain-containing protein [Pokkaliibacter plantistimulans]|uniref:WYL domain-containing protein n=1 Tax=Proteobacteria bacterium 228 TaxID=2083153 RepID=A0A2S5KJQ6_9PROT|nr:WYL domain-containing protein [Pokkaliibacter plantistimulans]PPC75067.1 WYL domain-containing protein [Pokkaliibacter plantistimulans]